MMLSIGRIDMINRLPLNVILLGLLAVGSFIFLMFLSFPAAFAFLLSALVGFVLIILERFSDKDEKSRVRLPRERKIP